MVYRPDIDGLRAVAVVAVILFHAFPEAFPGGFVGVDIFFVISGYLITSIIYSEMTEGSFSIANFYARRIRRIFPALSLVLSSTLLVGWFALLPSELAALGEHATAGAGFVANVFFWKEAGYFDTAADLKPTLHLWSLGIEEQFYIVWPLLLMLAVRCRAKLPVVVLALVAISFAANVAGVGRHAVAVFFLPFSRFWELLIGALLAVRLQTVAATAVSRQTAMLSFLGFGLLVAAFCFIDRSRHFPGWWALLPTLGSALLIYAGPGSWVNRRLLGTRLLVFVGLISYPLYLWHWPLMSLVRIVENGAPGPWLIVASIVISVVLAILTYRYAERFLRQSRQPWVVPSLLGIMLVVGISGHLTNRNNGFPERLSQYLERTKPNQNDLSDFENYRKNVVSCGLTGRLAKSLTWCLKGYDKPVDAVLWGDSHADHLFPGIVKHDADRNWMLLGTSSCPPLNGIVAHARGADDKRCHDNNSATLRWLIENPEIRLVILASLGPYYLTDRGYAPQHQGEWSPANFVLTNTSNGNLSKRDAFLSGMVNSIGALLAAGKRVVLIEDIPELPFMPEKCIGRPLGFSQPSCVVERDSVDRRRLEYKELLREIHEHYPSVPIYSAENLLCDAERCSGLVDGILMYRDSHHLSRRGSDYLGREFIKWLN